LRGNIGRIWKMWRDKSAKKEHSNEENFQEDITNFIWSYLHQIFDDSHGLKASLKPLRRPF